MLVDCSSVSLVHSDQTVLIAPTFMCALSMLTVPSYFLPVVLYSSALFVFLSSLLFLYYPSVHPSFLYTQDPSCVSSSWRE